MAYFSPASLKLPFFTASSPRFFKCSDFIRLLHNNDTIRPEYGAGAGHNCSQIISFALTHLKLVSEPTELLAMPPLLCDGVIAGMLLWLIKPLLFSPPVGLPPQSVAGSQLTCARPA